MYSGISSNKLICILQRYIVNRLIAIAWTYCINTYHRGCLCQYPNYHRQKNVARRRKISCDDALRHRDERGGSWMSGVQQGVGAQAAPYLVN